MDRTLFQLILRGSNDGIPRTMFPVYFVGSPMGDVKCFEMYEEPDKHMYVFKSQVESLLPLSPDEKINLDAEILKRRQGVK
jgi:hypothetical protein